MKRLFWLAQLPVVAFATPLDGFEKTYQDWDLVCDNTGTCRMAGYQAENAPDHIISLLFTRTAGENTPIRAQFALWPYNNESDKQLKFEETSEIILNGQSLGTVQNLSDYTTAELNNKQTTALLTALKTHADIQVVSGEFKGKLSDKGATAAMLKMDEFQQRLNTPSALIRQGQEKHAVLAPQAIPQVKAVRINHRKTIELKQGEKKFAEVLALLRESDDPNSLCSDLHSDTELDGQITLYPLTNGKVLAGTICVLGAYQGTVYYAVMNNKLNKVEQVWDSEYNYAGYDKKTHALMLTGTFKARGIGDCWAGQEAVWNGERFIRTKEYTTGSCKGFAGGAWQLPIFVSNIKVK